MVDFYSDPSKYGTGLYINQYINIYEKETSKRVDTLCWTKVGFRPLKYKDFTSKQLGEIKPYKDYYLLVFYSLV